MRADDGIGMRTESSSIAGPLFSFAAAVERKAPGRPGLPRFDWRLAVAAERALEGSVRRTSNSLPDVPRPVVISMFAGRSSFGAERLSVVREESGPSRSASYPHRAKRPSGGTKLIAPSPFYLLSRTHGWNTTRSMIDRNWSPLLPMPAPFPPVERFKFKSGTPLTLEVKAMLPFANAARGRPDGANVTDSDSTISTYSSLLVCRTLFLRHGIAEP